MKPNKIRLKKMEKTELLTHLLQIEVMTQVQHIIMQST